MTKQKFLLKTALKTLLLTFLVGLLNVQSIKAQGPGSPEAAGFEPVDATDMVNLVTGDLSYVLPLLNIPSPEGGYPIALSYHAGIAMDQEASWVGLGWNINPGAINRTVNGYPDDWKTAQMREIFYDRGGSKDQYFISVGYGIPNLYSVGLSFSWGSHRAFGGHVEGSFKGFSGSIGSEGVSVGLGSGPGASVNISIGYNGNIGVGMGYRFMNGMGLNMGYSNNGLSGGVSLNGGYTKDGKSGEISSKSPGSSVGISFSSKSVSVNTQAEGFGIGGFSHNFEQLANSGDYFTNETGLSYSLITPWFYISFGHRHYEWSLHKTVYNTIDGTLYGKSSYNDKLYSIGDGIGGSKYPKSYKWKYDNYELYTENVQWVDAQDFQTNFNNAYFRSIDNYSVTAQGISGTISPRSLQNYGLSHNNFVIIINRTDNIYISNKTPNNSQKRAEFYFNNEYSSFLRVLPSKLNNLSNAQEINVNDYLTNYLNGTENDDLLNNLPDNYVFTNGKDMIFYSSEGNVSYNESKNRLRKSSYIEYFTNKQIRGGKVNNFMEAKNINRSDFKSFLDDGIGAYRITTADGKTYHYSLPVYHYEKIQRTYNLVDKPENQAHFDKIFMDAYATHWLLTAITGPDYVKNSPDHIKYPDATNAYSDYGYWVRFDYGKWTDGFFWKTPYAKNWDEQTIDDKILKSYTWGRKQVFYLDKIKTRTHTALFVKNIRQDGQSRAINYKNMYHDRESRLKRVKIPAFKPLRLEKIIILNNKNIPAINKNNTISDISDEETYSYEFLASTRYGPPTSYGITSPAYVVFTANQQRNVLDIGDLSADVYKKASNIIEFNYGYDLALNNPYSSSTNKGKLTLKSVETKGKKGTKIMPPYRFNYIKKINDIGNSFNVEDKDKWGFRNKAPMLWSLNKITVPTGGEISIKYESDESVSAVKDPINFTRGNEEYELKIRYNPDISISVCSKNNDIIDLGDNFLINYSHTFFNTNNPEQQPFITVSKVTSAKVTEKNGLYYKLGNFSLPKNGSVNIRSATLNEKSLRGGGVRVSEIKVNNSTKTTYAYNGGITSFFPGDIEIAKKIPYLSELPAASVYYGNVSVQNKDNLDNLVSRTDYQFKTLSVKEEDKVKFGDIFELEEKVKTYNNKINNIPLKTKKVVVKDGKKTLGRLISRSIYNSENQLLSKKVNNYKEFNDFEQGLHQESYYSAKEVKAYGNNAHLSNWAISTSTRITYPSALESISETTGNFAITKYFDKHDFLTGQAIETRTYGSDGKGFKSKIVPAYTIPEYSNMGSKIDNPNNKNMLTQTAASYSYLLNVDGSKSIINAGITTWNNKWNYWDHKGVPQSGNNKGPDIWRKHKSFFWKGAIAEDGTYLNYRGEDDNFNWGIGAIQANSSKWQKASETTRYDHYSMPLEQKDVNGNYTATKMCDNNSKVLATSNAAYTEMYYSGAEYRVDQDKSYFDGEIKSFGYTESTSAHTGNYIVSIGKNQNAFEVKIPERAERNTPKRRRFKVSVWVRTAQKDKAVIKVGGSKILFRKNETITSGIWSLLNGYITIPPRQTTVAITSTSGTIELDDFRLHPITASMTSYVYNKFDEVTFITGANGLSTKYVYDEAGKLEETWVEVLDNPKAEIVGGFKRVHKNTYNYKNFNVTSFLPMSLNSSSTFTNYIINGGSGEFRYNWKIQVFKNGVQRQVRELTTRVGNIRLRRIENHRCSDVDINLKVIDLETNLSLDVFKFKRGDCSDGGDDPIPAGCFIAGTKITMSDGTLKNIEDVKVGDNIKTFNIDTKKIEEGEVLEFINPIKNNFIEIEFENGIKNTNTLDHPYYVKDKGWSSYDPKLTNINYKAKTQTLEVGDIVIMYKNSKVKFTKIKEITEIKQKQKVFNLKKVSKNHNYFANGILAHNKSKI